MKRNFVSGLAVLFLVTGCVSLSNQENKNGTQQTIQNKIVEGSTTKEQVKTVLGEATTVSFSNGGNEIWAYSYTDSSSKLENFVPITKIFASDISLIHSLESDKYFHPQLVITFDKNGIVSSYTINRVSNIMFE